MTSSQHVSADTAEGCIDATYQWNRDKPTVLVFDVNETLIDVDSLHPLFEQLFGERRVLREWFGHLIMYSMTMTLSGLYKDFFSLGQGILHMLGTIHGVSLKPSDIDELKKGMMTMPAHADVVGGLQQLKSAGFRMVTLTNSPPNPTGQSPLEHAGLAPFFERQFSIETVRVYKPAPLAYHLVAQELDVPPSSCCMVAAHVWDTVGAQSAGFSAALITRPGNAALPVAGLPQPNFVAPDLPALAAKLPAPKAV
jgi:2-haloacid dehalogenase